MRPKVNPAKCLTKIFVWDWWAGNKGIKRNFMPYHEAALVFFSFFFFQRWAASVVSAINLVYSSVACISFFQVSALCHAFFLSLSLSLSLSLFCLLMCLVQKDIRDSAFVYVDNMLHWKACCVGNTRCKIKTVLCLCVAEHVLENSLLTGLPLLIVANKQDVEVWWKAGVCSWHF